MTVNEMIPAFEAVLFASGEPVETERFCQIFDTDYETVDGVMKMLSDRLLDRQSAIRLLKLENSYQLASAKEYAEYIRAALDLRRKAPLSQAALEVLAVIAYNQPVTKAYVEQVRGVDCSGVVSTLVEKDLLEEGLSCRADRCFTVQQPISCAASGCRRLPIFPMFLPTKRSRTRTVS